MLHRKRLHTMLSLLLLLLLLAACDAPKTLLVVQVRDFFTQQPVSGAECRLGEGTARSDAAGRCLVAHWTPSDTVTVSASGYQEGSADLSALRARKEVAAVTTTVTLYPDRFAGVVLDAYSGQPLAGAGVTGADQPLATDAAGRFTVLNPSFPLDLAVTAPAYDSWQGSLLTTTARIALRPNTLTGVVTSLDDGRPLAGAAVTLTGSLSLTATTGPDGRYLLQGVPEQFSLQVRAERHRPAEFSLERVTQHDMALRPAFLRGLVHDEEGQPIALARVVYADTYTHTDALGHFLLPEVPETVVLQVLSPGYAREVVTVTAAGGVSITVPLTPFWAQGIYVTSYVAATPDWFSALLDFVERTDLNAMAIEVKDAWGAVTYRSELPLVQELNTADPRYNVAEVLRQCRERGIYTIAYIVVFEDSWMPKSRPEWAIHSTQGGLWRDHNGLNWADPYRREVWEYNVAIAKELALLGFDEVQFDYIRFPTDGNMATLSYSENVSGLSHEERIQKQFDTITAFLKYAYQEIGPTGAFISADVFGYAAWRKMWEQGQDISMMGHYLDFLCPMAYPSHYSRGELGCANPATCPYDIVLETMRLGYTQLDGGQRVKLRPWVQDFTLGGDPKYGPFEVREQVRGASDGGGVGFLLWNAGNVYTSGVDYRP